jgi:phage/plasmid-like protein (TIGR03299 family)
MAHDLEIVNGKASMFSVKETPWHKLGTVLDSPPDTETALTEAQANWEVKLLPLTIAGGTRRVEAFAVLRATDGKILSHHVGPDFTPLQNADAFKWFDPFVKSGEATLETAGVLHGGARVWIMARLNGSIAEIAEGDTVRNYLLLSNAHGIGESVRIGMTPTRVVCANTLSMAHGNGRLLRIRHTSAIAS